MHIATVTADLLRGGQAAGSQREMLRFTLLSAAIDLPPLGHILAPELPSAPSSLQLIQGVHAVHAALRRRVPIVPLAESGAEGGDAGGTTVLPLSLDRGIVEQVMGVVQVTDLSLGNPSMISQMPSDYDGLISVSSSVASSCLTYML